MTPKYNVLIIGKTGVGKSTLINYLFGSNIRKSGVGDSVTPQGFEYVEVEDSPFRIYDSWGLESGKFEMWERYLRKELDRRDGTGELPFFKYMTRHFFEGSGSDILTPIKDWFHSVFYCIGAGNARVEGSEINILRELMTRRTYGVTVLLTKADQASPEQLKALKDAIYEPLGHGIKIIEVCSERKSLRGGETKPFGKERVQEAILENFRRSIIMRVPRLLETQLYLETDKWEDKQKTFVKTFVRAGNKHAAHEHIEEESKRLISEIPRVAQETLFKTLDDAGNIYRDLFQNVRDQRQSLDLGGEVAFSEYDKKDDMWATVWTVSYPFIAPLILTHVHQKQLVEEISKFGKSLRAIITQDLLPRIEKNVSDYMHAISSKVS